MFKHTRRKFFGRILSLSAGAVGLAAAGDTHDASDTHEHSKEYELYKLALQKHTLAAGDAGADFVTVIDTRTGAEVNHVRRICITEGWLEQYDHHYMDGRVKFHISPGYTIRTRIRRGNFELRYKAPAVRRKPDEHAEASPAGGVNSPTPPGKQ